LAHRQIALGRDMRWPDGGGCGWTGGTNRSYRTHGTYVTVNSSGTNWPCHTGRALCTIGARIAFPPFGSGIAFRSMQISLHYPDRTALVADFLPDITAREVEVVVEGRAQVLLRRAHPRKPSCAARSSDALRSLWTRRTSRSNWARTSRSSGWSRSTNCSGHSRGTLRTGRPDSAEGNVKSRLMTRLIRLLTIERKIEQRSCRAGLHFNSFVDESST